MWLCLGLQRWRDPDPQCFCCGTAAAFCEATLAWQWCGRFAGWPLPQALLWPPWAGGSWVPGPRAEGPLVGHTLRVLSSGRSCPSSPARVPRSRLGLASGADKRPCAQRCCVVRPLLSRTRHCGGPLPRRTQSCLGSGSLNPRASWPCILLGFSPRSFDWAGWPLEAASVGAICWPRATCASFVGLAVPNSMSLRTDRSHSRALIPRADWTQPRTLKSRAHQILRTFRPVCLCLRGARSSRDCLARVFCGRRIDCFSFSEEGLGMPIVSSCATTQRQVCLRAARHQLACLQRQAELRA